MVVLPFSGRLVNQVKKLAEDIDPLPRVRRSPDPMDDFLLALSEAGKADYLVTGDKSGLLVPGVRRGARHASVFASMLSFGWLNGGNSYTTLVALAQS
jgi:predicted nucleic acid-binding protein